MSAPELDIGALLGRAARPRTAEQYRAVTDLSACRTAALGGTVWACSACGQLEYRYRSCGNRHCPKCQGGCRAAWLEREAGYLLPVEYHHVVFTLPQPVAELARHNPRLVYNLLFEAGRSAVQELAADPKHLGAQVGLVAVLHTWGQTLTLHPHLHVVATGGGLACDRTGRVLEPALWRSCRPGFFLPVLPLSQLYQGKFLAGLRRARTEGKLRFAGSVADLADERAWAQWLAERYREDWVVYSQPPCAGAEVVLKYLARYTHRVALSNSRLVRVTEEEVTFTYKDYRQEGQTREMTLDVEEFARRFLQHVLPRGFVRIRHYGLLANRGRDEKLRLCRHLLLAEPVRQAATAATEVTEVRPLEPWVCPGCGRGEMRLVELLGRAELAEEEPAWEDSS